jgi:hypothetical protein
MNSDVVFQDSDDSNNQVGNIRIIPGEPTGMLSWLVKKQIAKNAKQAEQYLLWIAIAAVAITAVIAFLSLWSPNSSTVDPLLIPYSNSTVNASGSN